MKKIFLLIIFTVMSFYVVSADSTNGSTLFIESKPVTTVNIIKDEKTIWVPLRIVFESLGSKVIWVKENESIIVTHRDTYCVFEPNKHSSQGSEYNVYLGEELVYKSDRKTVNGITYIPEHTLNYILEKWGYSIWVDEKTIGIEQKKYISGVLYVNNELIKEENSILIRDNHGIRGEILVSFSSILGNLGLNVNWTENPNIVKIKHKGKTYICELEDYIIIYLENEPNEWFRLNPMGSHGYYTRIKDKIYLGNETTQFMLKELGYEMIVKDDIVTVQ